MVSQDVITVTAKTTVAIGASVLGVALSQEYLISLVVSVLIIIGSLSYQASTEDGIKKKHFFLCISAILMSAGTLYYYYDYRQYIYMGTVFLIIMPDEFLGVLKAVTKKWGISK